MRSLRAWGQVVDDPWEAGVEGLLDGAAEHADGNAVHRGVDGDEAASVHQLFLALHGLVVGVVEHALAAEEADLAAEDHLRAGADAAHHHGLVVAESPAEPGRPDVAGLVAEGGVYGPEVWSDAAGGDVPDVGDDRLLLAGLQVCYLAGVGEVLVPAGQVVDEVADGAHAEARKSLGGEGALGDPLELVDAVIEADGVGGLCASLSGGGFGAGGGRPGLGELVAGADAGHDVFGPLPALRRGEDGVGGGVSERGREVVAAAVEEAVEAAGHGRVGEALVGLQPQDLP